MDVLTISGNLLAEWTFDVEALALGATHRASSMSFQTGGKGVNVTRILVRLGRKSEAVGFAGGPLATLCAQWLESQGIPHRLFPLEAGVRPGLVVREAAAAGRETTFLGADLPLPFEAWKTAMRHLAESRPAWVALCGSIPGWRPSWKNALRQLMEDRSRVRLAVDTYGPPLADLVSLPLDLVKINRTELDKLFPQTAGQPMDEAIRLAHASSPVRNWIITDGPRPIRADLEEGIRLAIRPAAIREVSPTGSGDTFLAALLHQWLDQADPATALSFAVGCATANAASEKIGDFPLPLPPRFQPEIEVLS